MVSWVFQTHPAAKKKHEPNPPRPRERAPRARCMLRGHNYQKAHRGHQNRGARMQRREKLRWALKIPLGGYNNNVRCGGKPKPTPTTRPQHRDSKGAGGILRGAGGFQNKPPWCENQWKIIFSEPNSALRSTGGAAPQVCTSTHTARRARAYLRRTPRKAVRQCGIIILFSLFHSLCYYRWSM